MDQAASRSEQAHQRARVGQSGETLRDGLDQVVRLILRTRGLPVRDEAVEFMIETVECARACASLNLDRPRMGKRAATKFRNAMRTGVDLSSKYGVASAEELKVLRRILRLAEVEALMPPTKSGPRIRVWLWYWCEEFLEFWRRTTDRPPGVWMRDSDLPSPALAFLVDCCRLVDPTVNASAILYAKENAEPSSPNAWQLSHEDFAARTNAQHDAYNELWQSEWLQKLHEPNL